MVVFVVMLLTQDLGFQQAPEYFQVEKLIPESRVETLNVRILPRASRRNKAGAEPMQGDPFLHLWVLKTPAR